jgi:hypothetical protein
MKPRHVELHIETLVLHGFAPGDHHRIGAVMARELARLLAEHGVPSFLAHNIAGPSRDPGVFNVAPGATVEALGVQVAQAVYEGLNK